MFRPLPGESALELAFDLPLGRVEALGNLVEDPDDLQELFGGERP